MKISVIVSEITYSKMFLGFFSQYSLKMLWIADARYPWPALCIFYAD